ncbi:MAG: type IV pilus assembly protein PilM [Vulcanimicrobiota bacterium]
MDFFRKLFSKAPELGAIDIGSNMIKVAIVNEKKGAPPELYRYAQCATPPMTIKDGSIVDAQLLGETIAGLLASSDIQVGKLVSAVAGQQVVIRPIQMTKMKQSEVNQAIKFEAERYLPYSVTDASVSGMIINEHVDERSMEVLLIAVPNEIVANAREVVKMAEVEPGPIDLEPLALFRSLKHCVSDEQMAGTLALINLGASFSSINIFRQRVLRHNRTISIAGNSFTKAIGQSLNLSFEEAEKIKKEKGVIRVENNADPVPPTTMRIFNLIVPVLTELVTEIQRSFDYYRSRYKDGAVDLVILSGGTAKFKNIDQFLANELGVKAEIANPFRGINAQKVPGLSQADLADIAPNAMVALGLALREAQ